MKLNKLSMLLISFAAIIAVQSPFIKAQDSGWYPEFLKPVVDTLLKDKTNATLLDVGTGPGKLPEILITANPDLHITGIDIDTGMIDLARKRLQNPNVSYQYEKINAPLDFADSTFDVVTFCSVLFLVSDSVKTLLMNEAMRVLKPGGKVVVLTPSGRRPAAAIAEIWRFPFSVHNWTYIVWRTLTASGGRHWQKAQWLAKYGKERKLNYSNTLTFHDNAAIEIIYKPINQ
jgi:ubiquinone/menaquinone biosynthesis C-methylase UbiE